MSQYQQELTLEESVKQVMQTLPPVIRDYLSQGKYTPIARNLMAKYGLRIDQGGILERGMMLLLMGIEDPAEFSKTLAEEAKLDQETINGIMQDVNTQIFIPLREEMRKGTEAVASKSPVASAPSAPRAPQSHFHLENKIPLPTQPNRSAPHKPALRDVLASVMRASPDANHVSVEPRKLLADHEEPHIEFKSKAPVAVPNIVAPTAPSEAPPPHKPVTPQSPTPFKPITSYSIDPYREPVDEK